MVTLRTERLVLRELSEEDFPALRRLDSDPEVVRYQANDVCDEARTRTYLERSMRGARERPRTLFDLAVTRSPSPALLGRVGFSIARPEHREAMLWFVLQKDAWGQGYATEAVVAVLSFAFSEGGAHRVYGDCDPRNLGSARVMEKAGMRREGHLRQNWFLKGEWCDSLLYAALAPEWQPPRR